MLKVLRDSDFAKFAFLSKDLPVLLDLVSSGKCAAHGQKILGVEDIAAAMSGLSVRSKKVSPLVLFCFFPYTLLHLVAIRLRITCYQNPNRFF